jgi:AAA domain
MKFFTGSNAPTVKPVPWLVPGFLARGAGTILFGQPGVGKTTHGAALTASLVMGEDFGPFQVLNPCRVLYVDFDGGWDWNANLFYAAFRALGLEGLPDEFAYFSPLTEACRDPENTGLIALEKIGGEIAHAVLEHRADIVVLDSLGQAMAGDPNSGQDVALALRLGLNPAREAGASVLVLDHATKAARMVGSGVPTPAGSQQKRAWARVTVALEAEGENGHGVRWSIDKTNASPWKPFLTRLEFVSVGDRLDTMTLEFEGEAGERSQPEKVGGEIVARKAILEALTAGPKKRGELPNNGTVQRTLKQLLEAGEVTQLSRGVYALPEIASKSESDDAREEPLDFNQSSNHDLTTPVASGLSDEKPRPVQHLTVAPTHTTVKRKVKTRMLEAEL